MNYKIAPFWILLGLSAGLYEAVFLTFLGPLLSSFYPVIFFIIILIISNKIYEAWMVGLIGGFVRDIFVLDGNVFYVAQYFIIAIVVSRVAQSVLTNRSLYSSVAMIIFARLFMWFWLFLLEKLYSVFGFEVNIFFYSNHIWHVLLADALLIVMYFFINNFIVNKFSILFHKS